MKHSCEITSKSDRWFQRRQFFKKFFMYVYSASSPHSPELCFLMAQNFPDNFWKGSSKEHSCEFFSKSHQQFQKIFYQFLHVRIMQVAPIHQCHVYRRIKISRTLSEKGHPRNISVKLFQNLTGGFREDFLISSCLYIVQIASIYQRHVSWWMKI